MEQPDIMRSPALTSGCRCVNTYSAPAVNGHRPKSKPSQCCACMHSVGLCYSAISKLLHRDKSLIVRWAKKSAMYVARPSKHRRWPGVNQAIRFTSKEREWLRWNEWAGACYADNYWSRHPSISIYRNQKRYNEDIQFRLKSRARKRVRAFLKIKGIKKTKSVSRFIGCTGRHLKQHIERNMREGMTWCNYGTDWCIDHLVPLASATNEQEALRLSHWTNLQPMFRRDNIIKGDKMMKQCALL